MSEIRGSGSEGVWPRHAELFRKNLFSIVTYCSAFWTFGLCVGFLGSTLWDLECMVELSLPKTTWLFIAQVTFMMLGSVAAGCLLSKIYLDILLLIAIALIGLSLVLVPFAKHLMGLLSLMTIMGFNMGLVDTCGNVAMIRLFRENVSPFLQVLHFCYGLGVFFTSLFAAPFLRNTDCNSLRHHVGNSTELELKFKHNHFEYKLYRIQNNFSVQCAFWIFGVIQVPILILLFIHQCKKPNILANNEDEELETSRQRLNTKKFCGISLGSVLILLLTAVLLCFSEGIQAGYSDYVFSIGRFSGHGAVASNAAITDAIFWGCLAVGRFLAIFIAVNLTPESIIFNDIAFCAACLVLQVWLNQSQGILLVLIGCTGLGMASISPALYSLAERSVKISSGTTSILVLIAVSGEIVFPLCMSNILNDYDTESFLISNLVAVGGMFIVLFTLWIFLLARGTSSDDEKRRLLQ